MQCKDLIRFLEEFDPEKEIAIVVKSIETKKEIAATYDIGYDKNEFEEPVFKIQVETSFDLATH